MLKKAKTFFKQNPTESYAIIATVVLGAFLRLWRISEYMTFLGDEGRDARVVYRLITQADIILVGPMTSVLTEAGHMFLGPAYYYLMAPAMLLAGGSPVGPAIMVAVFSLATIVMMWWFSRVWFNSATGLIAAFLYAISPTVITFSHSSWNPNIMPFFALLAIWSIYKVWQNNSPKWLITTGLCVAMILQSHYLGLLLIPTLGLFWLVGLIKHWKTNKSRHLFYGFAALTIVILSFLPLVVFDARHEWINSKAMYAFFTVRQTTVNLKVYKGFELVPEIITQIFDSLLTAKNILITRISFLFIGLTLVLHFLRKKQPTYTAPLILLITWLGFGLIGLSIYKQTLFDHYFGFLFPVPHILIAVTIQQLWAAKGTWALCASCVQIRKAFAGIFLFALVFSNLAQTPIRFEPNRQYPRTAEIAQQIITESEGQPFNIALLSKSNYDESYRFIFERAGAPLVPIEPQNPDSITSQLYVICENSDQPDSPPDEKCAPINHPQSEIALFGWAKIEQKWEYPWGHKLYKLSHFNLQQQYASLSQELNQYLSQNPPQTRGFSRYAPVEEGYNHHQSEWVTFIIVSPPDYLPECEPAMPTRTCPQDVIRGFAQYKDMKWDLYFQDTPEFDAYFQALPDPLKSEFD